MQERADRTGAARPGYWLARTAGLCLATLLAGCQTPERAATGSPAPQAPASEMLALPASGAVGGQSVVPKRVMGLDELAIQQLLGAPRLIRREAPAEVWQYRTAACVLDLFLYDEAAGRRVTYAEARTAGAEPVPPEPCLNQILATRQQRLSSS
jgi:hypothetical protein